MTKVDSLPPIHNSRSPQQWEIIKKYVDFKDKTVLDIGFGYGDILLRCRHAKVKHIYGVDKEPSLVSRLGDIFFNLPTLSTLEYKQPGSTLAEADFVKYIPWDIDYDIIICFSVLPYLKQPFTVLEWIKEHSQIALIEIQLFGDGPGSNDWLRGQIKENPEVTYLVDDEDVYLLLRAIGWKHVENIGVTVAEKDKNYDRAIWLCR